MQNFTETLRKEVIECLVEKGADFTHQEIVLIAF